MPAKAIMWLGNRVKILDQSQLPQKEVYLELDDPGSIASAIVELKIRGAPAIGIAAAYAVALGALKIQAASPQAFHDSLKEVTGTIAATRPTARNLFWAIERMQRVAASCQDTVKTVQALIDEAVRIHKEQIEADHRLGETGAALIKDGDTVLTHCNTGPLATGGYGTALGIIIKAHEQGKNIRVLATETRPLLQGARLTAWELKQADVPFALITDSMAGYYMSRGQVSCVILGADRIAANGDTANKIGTYSLAVLARENGIPFYVAAPTTTIDPSIADGDGIIIEERNPQEVTHIRGLRLAPEGINVLNPAFDVTPHRYITAIITERGIMRPPFGEGMSP